MKKAFFTVLALIGVLLVPAQAANAAEITSLRFCSIVQSTPCIESVLVNAPGESAVAAKLTGEVKSWASSFATQPVSINADVLQVEGVKHTTGTEDFYVEAYRFPDDASYCWARDMCSERNGEYVVKIMPAWWKTSTKFIQFKTEPTNMVCGSRENPSICTMPEWLNPGYEYSVKLRLESSFGVGWVVGESAMGKVKIEKVAATDETLLTISAAPILKSSVWTTELHPKSWQNQDAADVDSYRWDVYVLSKKHSMAEQFSRCEYGEGLAVWHNSDQILTLPTWDAANQVLKMEVAAPHLRADGALNEAQFSFQMPLSLIKCLWGLNLAKAFKAQVSVTDDGSGGAQAATILAGSDEKNYYFQVAGLHYSSPQIRVKMTQVSDPVKKTILCRNVKKPKLTKKVTAVLPKCPSGYKVSK